MQPSVSSVQEMSPKKSFVDLSETTGELDLFKATTAMLKAWCMRGTPDIRHVDLALGTIRALLMSKSSWPSR